MSIASFCALRLHPPNHPPQTSHDALGEVAEGLVGRQIRPRRPALARIDPGNDRFVDPRRNFLVNCQFECREHRVHLDDVIRERIGRAKRNPHGVRAQIGRQPHVIRPQVVDGPQRHDSFELGPFAG